MKIGSDCSGECRLCAYSGFCLAGHGDNLFWPATKDQLVERVKNAEYDWEQTKSIIKYLQAMHGYKIEIDEKEWREARANYIKMQHEKMKEHFTAKEIAEALKELLAK